MEWLFVVGWLLVGLVAAVWAARSVLRLDEEVFLVDLLGLALLVLLGPASLLGVGFIVWLDWLDDHDPIVVWRKRRR